ncbi:Suppressor of HU sensitivity involved in recombination protein 1 [Nakaseomyces bracarensis]|uniref:Suppressor of HU sensitivity involved in recombination protein 1 n=2 Tax=Nakaseomyces bracarensis TaxID=273131 RepID=A0ABR4NN17_9SACH
MEMTIKELIESLLLEDFDDTRKRKTLILVLGDEARLQFESQRYTTSTIGSLLRGKNDIGVLFLNSLQYLFMYLMKLEVSPDAYNHLVIYGLDSLVCNLPSKAGSKEAHEEMSLEQVRAANLIYQAAFKVQRTHQFNVTNFINYRENEPLERIELYWKVIC